MKNSKILIHIPHSSLKLPKVFWKRVITSEIEIDKENLELTDFYVDKLVEDLKVNKLIFGYSRLFCDVERYKDDKKESMSKIGMGCIYTHNADKKRFIEYEEEYKNNIIKNYYDTHHIKLDNLSNSIIKKYDKCLLIDLHSFSDTTAKKLLNLENNPDICIGVDEIFEDKKITNEVKKFFESNGYSVMINYPYKGTIIPNEIYKNKDNRLIAFMLEINKRIYLDENKKNKIKFDKLKSCIEELLINFKKM